MLDTALDLIQKTKWIFAKTYKDFAPHEYIVRDDNKRLCHYIDLLMLNYQVKKTFFYPGGSKDFNYLYLGDYRYWYTNKGKILNRCPRNQTFDWSNKK